MYSYWVAEIDSQHIAARRTLVLITRSFSNNVTYKYNINILYLGLLALLDYLALHSRAGQLLELGKIQYLSHASRLLYPVKPLPLRQLARYYFTSSTELCSQLLRGEMNKFITLCQINIRLSQPYIDSLECKALDDMKEFHNTGGISGRNKAPELS